MQVEALDACLQCPERAFDPVLARLATHASERRAGARAEGLSPRDGSAVTRGEDGGLVGDRVGITGRVVEPTVSAQMTQHAAPDHGEQLAELAVARGGELVERELAALGCGEYAIHHQHMRVNVQVGGGAKALCREANTLGVHEGDGARLCGLEAAGFRHARVEGQHGPHQQAEHRDHARMVIGESIAKRVRPPQHPLANGDARDDMSNAVRGEVSPAATSIGPKELAGPVRQGHGRSRRRAMLSITAEVATVKSSWQIDWTMPFFPKRLASSTMRRGG